MDTTDNEINWAEFAEHTKNDVEEAIRELCTILSNHDPIELISRVAIFVLVSHPEEPKDSGGPAHSETNLEYLVSLATAHPFSLKRDFPNPDTVQRTIELLTIVQMAASWHYKFRRRSKCDTQSPIEEIADSFRMDKLHVRGDAYWPHLRLTISELLEPHDIKLKDTVGFTWTDYISFMERTEDELNERISEEMRTHCEPFMKMYGPWMKAKGKGDDDLDVEGWSRFVASNEAAVSEAKERFDRFGSPDAFVFRPQSDEERRILRVLSCDIGSNSLFLGTKPEHAFWPLTPSATDSHPIVHHDEIYYGFNLSKLSREAHTLIGDLLRKADPDYWEHKFLKARDEYLESEAAKLLKVALPSAQVLRSVAYPICTGGSAEADIVILCDDILMIVECKASRIDPATKRGADKKVVSDMKQTIAGALNQAERFVRELVERGAMQVTPDGAASVTVHASQFQRVFRVNVTLDLISSAATELWKLTESGLAPNAERCWSVSLNDLRVIVDILDQPALFIHYLVRRLDINALKSVVARDELDYLMHYVKHGLFFREGNAPKIDESIMLNGFTEDLDQYYRKLQGVSNQGSKPRVGVGKRTQTMLSLLQSKMPEHWSSGCIQLLEFDTAVREELLGKLPDHLRQLRHPRSGYALSFTANFETLEGFALATSKQPSLARDIVLGRCIDHCRQHNFKEVWILLLGVPVHGSGVSVMRATPETNVSDDVERLLKQLEIHATEYRRTGFNEE